MSDDYWPALHPPMLKRLPMTANGQKQVIPSSLELEIEQLDRDEERFAISMHSVRNFGYSWLIPLGRLNTHEEDQESSFSSSPPARLDSPGAAHDQQPLTGLHAGQNDHAMQEQEQDLDAGIESADDDSFAESGTTVDTVSDIDASPEPPPRRHNLPAIDDDHEDVESSVESPLVSSEDATGSESEREEEL